MDKKMKRYLKRQAQEGKSLFRKLFPKDGSHEKHFDDVDRLCEMRMQVVKARVGSEKTLELLENYYAQLKHIDERFPVGSTDLVIDFKWRNAFNPIEESSSTNIEFEMVCVLFNIAATHSQLACEKSDDPKIAAKHFRIAAGVLDKVIASTARTGRDLRDETLNTLKGMCLASAQTLFYLTAKRANMSPKLLCALAMGGKELWEKIEAPGKRELGRVWYARIEFQTKCMEGTAHRWQAKSGAERDQGFMIARYKVAERAALKAEDIAIRSSLVGLDDQMKPLVSAIQKELREAVDTNNGVMMDRVPESRELEPIKGRVMVKPETYEVPSAAKAKKLLFKDVLPPNVTKIAREFKVHAENVLRKKQEETRLNSDTARAKLASMNLPGALDSKQDGGGIPNDVWNQVVTFRKSGGVAGLQDRISKNREIGLDVARKLRKCKDILETEKRQDETYRARFQGQWNRLQSDRLIGSFEAELAQYEKTLEKAKDSDMSVEKKLMNVLDVLTSLMNGGSRVDMERALPGVGSSSSNSGGNNSTQLRKALVDISNLLKERDEALSRMEIALTGDGGDEFVKVLLEMNESSKDEIFKKELQRRVGKDTQVLADSVKHQKDLMNQVTSEFQKWTRSEGDVDEKRARAINSLRNCVDKANEITRDIRSGERFYETLRRHVERTEQVVEDHLEARGMEAKDLESRRQPRSSRNDNNSNVVDALPTLTMDEGTKRPDVVVPRELAAAMAQLSMMGFTDSQRNVQVLKETNGDVKRAVHKLCS